MSPTALLLHTKIPLGPTIELDDILGLYVKMFLANRFSSGTCFQCRAFWFFTALVVLDHFELLSIFNNVEQEDEKRVEQNNADNYTIVNREPLTKFHEEVRLNRCLNIFGSV